MDVEAFVKRDEKAEWKEWERRCKQIIDSVSSVKGVNTEVKAPQISNRVPHIHITWHEAKIKIKPKEVVKAPREGTPAIEVTPSPADRVIVAVWMLAAE